LDFFKSKTYIQLYKKSEPKLLKHKTPITRSYLHVKIVAVMYLYMEYHDSIYIYMNKNL